MRLMASASSSTSSRKVGCKQRLRDDVESEVHHVDGNVAGFPSSPAVAHVDRFLNHRARVFRNALTMKGRLRDLPLRAMLSAFAVIMPSPSSIFVRCTVRSLMKLSFCTTSISRM